MTSLTPHEDAFRRIMDRTPLPDDPLAAASLRVIRCHQLECAQWMDQGNNPDDALTLTASVSASILDSIASSAASGHSDPAAARSYFLGVMLSTMMQGLSGGIAPISSAHEDIDTASRSPGRA